MSESVSEMSAPERDPWDLAEVPSVERYRQAFLDGRPLFAGNNLYLEMLKENYYAPEHTLTPGQMAAAMGWASYSSANLQYGRYAGEICTLLGLTPGRLGCVGPIKAKTTVNVSVLVRFRGGKPDDELVKWIMLPQVVEALEGLRWVRPGYRAARAT